MSVSNANLLAVFRAGSQTESLSQSVSLLFSRSPSCSVFGCWRLSLFAAVAAAAAVVPAGPH